jgi:hypothetical protein
MIWTRQHDPIYMNPTPQPEALLFKAPTSAVPAGYVQVVRWVSAGEVDIWLRDPKLLSPEVRGTQSIPVALVGAAKPAGTGRFRLQFWLRSDVLTTGDLADWCLISGPAQGITIVNLQVFGPEEFKADFVGTGSV